MDNVRSALTDFCSTELTNESTPIYILYIEGCPISPKHKHFDVNLSAALAEQHAEVPADAHAVLHG